MSNKRVIILEGMYLDCPDADIGKIDFLYKNNLKGVAIKMMLRSVRDEWLRLHKRLDNAVNTRKYDSDQDFYIKRISLS